jgi:outer membrane protein
MKTGFVFSQSYDTIKILTLKEALEIARANYPSIKQKLAQREASFYQVKAVQTNYLPNFIVQGQVLDATSNTVRGMFFPNDGTAIPVSGGIKTNGYTNDAVWTSFATGLIDWNFFNFGKYKSSVNAAKAGMVANEADYRNEIFQQQIKVGDAYLLALIANDMLKAQRANLVRVKALLDVTLAYTSSGIKPGVDSSLVKAEYSKATLQFLESRRIAQEQAVNLKELMGIKSELNYELDTVIYQVKQPQPFEVLDDYGNNPRLIFFKSLVEANQARIKSIKQSEYPSISFLGSGWARGSGISNQVLSDGSFQYNKSFGAGVGFKAYDWMLGVSTVWNFTSLFRTGDMARAQKQMTTVAQERYNEETLRVESELQRAKLRYAAALEVARQAPIQLKAAHDAYGQSKSRYESGLTSIIELTQTFSLLNRAEVDASMAKGSVWRAVIQYAAATGNLTVFTNNLD